MGLLKRLHLIEDAEDYSEEMQFGRNTANIPEQPETDIAGSAVYEGEAGTDTLIEDIYMHRMICRTEQGRYIRSRSLLIPCRRK